MVGPATSGTGPDSGADRVVAERVAGRIDGGAASTTKTADRTPNPPGTLTNRLASSGLGRHSDRLLAALVDVEREDVQTLVVAHDVVKLFRFDALGDVDVSIGDAFLALESFGAQLSARIEDHGDRRWRVGEDLLDRGVHLSDTLDCRVVEDAGGDDVEDLALEGVRRRADLDGPGQVVVPGVPRPPGRPGRWKGRDVELLALGQEGIAGQGVGVLAADERPDPADVGVDGTKLAGVALGPGQLLRP